MVHVDVPGEFRVIGLIDLDDRVEQLGDSFPVSADCRHYRHSEQVSECLDVESVSFFAQLVIHVQGHYHAQVHVYDLGGEVEVPFQIGRVHHVHYHIRHFLYEVAPDIKLLGTVCRQGICPRKVHQDELVSAVFELAFLGVDGHSAVVPYMLVASRSDVEKRSLAAVRVPHQGNADDVPAFLCQMLHLFFQHPGLLAVGGFKRGLRQGSRCHHFLCFGLAYDLYLVRFLAAQTDLVADDFVFYRVFERRVQYHFHAVAFHKAHFNDSFAEASVSVHLYYDTVLSCLKFRKFHLVPFFLRSLTGQSVRLPMYPLPLPSRLPAPCFFYLRFSAAKDSKKYAPPYMNR